MRCPHCDTPNDPGASACVSCGQMLTQYAPEAVTSPERIAERLARVTERPPIVAVTCLICAAAAIVGPFRAAATAVLRRTAVPDEAGGYLANALGAVSGFVVAAVLVPIGLFLLLVAAAAWTQRSWAWTAVAVLLTLAGLAGALTFAQEPLAAAVRVGAAGALAYFWFQPQTREWYGTG